MNQFHILYCHISDVQFYIYLYNTQATTANRTHVRHTTYAYFYYLWLIVYSHVPVAQW